MRCVWSRSRIWRAGIPAQLSGGQRQRVALARAIMLDRGWSCSTSRSARSTPSLRREMQLFLKEIQRTIRTTFLFVTHDQEEAIAMADRICVMDHGRVVQVGTPEDIYWRPVDTYVARFFGDANLIPGGLGARDGARAPRRHRARATCSPRDRPDLPERLGLSHLMVRPEAIRLDGSRRQPDRRPHRRGRLRRADVPARRSAAGGTLLKAKLPSRAARRGPGRRASSSTVSFAAADARPVTE